MRPVFIASLERLLDQQSPEPGTIDVQIRFDLGSIIELQRVDEPVLTAQLYVHHFPLEPLHPSRLRVLAQIHSVQTRIKMKRVGKTGKNESRVLYGTHELAKIRRGAGERVLPQRCFISELTQP